MIASGYSMHLYCRRSAIKSGDVSDAAGHDYSEFPHDYTGETYGECARQARKAGWVFNRDGDVTCPKCAGQRGENVQGAPGGHARAAALSPERRHEIASNAAKTRWGT